MDEYLDDIRNFLPNWSANIFSGELTQELAKQCWLHWDYYGDRWLDEDSMRAWVKRDLATLDGAKIIDALLLTQVNFDELWTAVQKMKEAKANG